MAQPSPTNFPSWNNSHPLVVPTNSLAIPQVAFKLLPKYDGSTKMPYEYCQDVSILSSCFDINDETIMMRLLSHYLKERLLNGLELLPLNP